MLHEENPSVPSQQIESVRVSELSNDVKLRKGEVLSSRARKRLEDLDKYLDLRPLTHDRNDAMLIGPSATVPRKT